MERSARRERRYLFFFDLIDLIIFLKRVSILLMNPKTLHGLGSDNE